MRAPVLALLLLGGCDALFGLTHLGADARGGGPPGDANGDDSIGGRTICVGTHRGFQEPFCFAPGTSFPSTFVFPTTFNTVSDCSEMRQQADGPSLCIVRANAITIASNVRATGPAPLVIVGVNSIQIAAVVDVSSYKLGATNGAGANTSQTTPCPTTVIEGSTSVNSSGGGGAGGSFVGIGGNGGAGITAGATAVAGESPTAIRGGCNGGRGGAGLGSTIGPQGGDGGGAVYLASNGAITVSGSIYAFGAGGLGGEKYQGGAGGGAGGMIVLDAPVVTAGSTSQLWATGGGGGQGGTAQGSGAAGENGDLGTGGAGQGVGGTGGAGSAGPGTSGGSGSPAGGGGGGGGGGYIGIASPTPQLSSDGSYRPSPTLQ